jgi:hypothetical protein
VRKGLLAVLGGVPSDKWKSLLIAPGDTNYFSVVIDPGLLDVRRGDELRVEVDSWSSEVAMRTGESEKQLTSPPFECTTSYSFHWLFLKSLRVVRRRCAVLRLTCKTRR